MDSSLFLGAKWCPDWALPVGEIETCVVCLPYAGGSAAAWMGWQTALRPEATFCPYELPGHGMRYGSALATDRMALVATLAQNLRPLAQNGKLVLMGHSMGATLAYEVALQLDADIPLILSGRAAPGVASLISDDLSDATLIDSLKRRGGTAAHVLETPELLALVLPVLRADYQLLRAAPMRRSEYAAPTLVLGGTEDPDVPLTSLLRWREVCPDLTVKSFPGDHFFVQGQTKEVQSTIKHWLANLW